MRIFQRSILMRIFQANPNSEWNWSFCNMYNFIIFDRYCCYRMLQRQEIVTGVIIEVSTGVGDDNPLIWSGT